MQSAALILACLFCHSKLVAKSRILDLKPVNKSLSCLFFGY